MTAKAGTTKDKGGAKARTHTTKAKAGPTKEKGGTKEHRKAKARVPTRLTMSMSTGTR